MKVQVLLTTVGLVCAGFAAGYPSDLVFRQSFDSSVDILNKSLNPQSDSFNGEVLAGKFGGALQVAAQTEAIKYTLPVNAIGTKGAIDFWGKLPESAVLSDQGCPKFYTVDTSDGTSFFAMEWNLNNGSGGSGLHAGGFGCNISTGWTSYDAGLAVDTYGWHHYAFVWNTNGVSGLPSEVSGAKCAALFVDGNLVGSAPVRNDFTLDGAKDKPLNVSFPLRTGEPASYLKVGYLIDEFRIWSTDRTTFPEGPINPDVVLPVVSAVTAKQHYPWCGKIDIGYTVAGSTDGLQVKITVKDNTNDKTYEAKTFDKTPTAAAGAHTVVWDATADGVTTASQNMVATVSLIVPVPAE